MKILGLHLSVSYQRWILTLLPLLLCLAVHLGAQPLPAPPTKLTASIMPGAMPGVELRWQPPAGMWPFRVYRSIGDSTSFGLIGVAPVPTYQDRQVLLSYRYYYYVTAFVMQESLVVEGPRSNIVGITVNSAWPQGSILGTVISDANGAPIPNVRIQFYRLDGHGCWLPPIYTDALGHYQARLDTGNYFIRAEPPMGHPGPPIYRPEWYDNAASPSAATRVAVVDNSIFTADFGLSSVSAANSARIEGLVLMEQGMPLVGATVVIMRTIQEMYQLAATTGTEPGTGEEARYIPGIGYCRGVIWSGPTDGRGRFSATVPADANYIALAAKPGYVPEYYDNQYDPTQAEIIHADSVVEGIDFALRVMPEHPNRVRGVVRDSSGLPIPSRVILFPRPRNNGNNVQGRVVHTDSVGFYSIDHVQSGSYLALALPFSTFAPGFYKEGNYGIINWQLADTIEAMGTVSNVNVGVVRVSSAGLTRVNGTLTSPQGQAVFGGQVFAHAADGLCVGTAIADGSGAYVFENVPAGFITVTADRTGFGAAQTTTTIPTNTYTIQIPALSLGQMINTGTCPSGDIPQTIRL